MITLKQLLVERGNPVGHGLAEIARSSLNRDGPSLAERLAASSKGTRWRHSETINKSPEVLSHV